MVFSCCGCGILIGIDGPLPGLVQPVHDLLGRLGSFCPDPVASRVKRGLASLHSMVQEKRGVLYQPVEGGVVREHHRGQVVLPVHGCLVDVGSQVLGDRFVGHLCLAVTLGVVGSVGGMGDL